LHVGVFDRAIQGEADLSPARVGVVFIVGTTCRTETIQRGLMFLSRILAAAGRATTERQLRSLPFCHPAWELACLLDLRSLVPSYSGPRAPPCRVTI